MTIACVGEWNWIGKFARFDRHEHYKFERKTNRNGVIRSAGVMLNRRENKCL